MKCTKAQELFSSYLEKTIQPPMGVAFEQHLAECAQCKASYDRFHATAVVLDELPVVEPPPDMHAAIMARIEQARRESPSRVRWLHLDWQGMFNLRAPAKALALGAAMMLVLVMLVQMTPLHTITASIIGGQRASDAVLDDPGLAPKPLPPGVKSDAGMDYANVSGGLSIGVVAASSTDYTIRIGTGSASAIPVQVYLLPKGSVADHVSSEDLAHPLYVGAVSENRSAAVQMVITQPGGAATVALVTWKNDGRSYSEFAFLPSGLGPVSDGASLSVSDAGVGDILSRLASDYGSVILAPGSIAGKTASVEVGAASGDEAIGDAMKQMGMTWQPLGKSVYEVK